jgi:hypothetical protein
MQRPGERRFITCVGNETNNAYTNGSVDTPRSCSQGVLFSPCPIVIGTTLQELVEVADVKEAWL